jgi:biopolymer transport protein ExbB
MRLVAARSFSVQARILGIVLAIGGSTILLQVSGPTAIAQDEIEKDAPMDAKAAEPTPMPAEPAAPTGVRQSYLGWLYSSLGLLYSVIFLCLSFALVAVFVMNVLTARRDYLLPAQLIEGFEAQLNAKNYQGAYELAKSDESFLGKVLSAGLARISSGYPQAVEAMQEVGEEENMRLDHRLSFLALIGTVCPMFGLLGTVDGMVQSFNVIATSSAGAPNPTLLAGGISKALVTTLVGLWLAIPAIAAFNILRNRIARLVLEVGIVSENLMSRFQNVGPLKQ